MGKKIVLGAVVLAVVGGVAFSQVASGVTSLPSSKAAVALGDLIDLLALASYTGALADDTGYVTVMQTYIKPPNMKDLSADVAIQCGIVTDTTVRSKNGSLDISQAKGWVSTRVKATNADGSVVRYFEPSEEGTLPDGTPVGVTYCSRLQRLEARFSGLNCTTDLVTGVVTCADPETLRLLLETLDANSFNYLMPDVAPGVWKVEVQARAQANVLLDGDGGGLGSAGAKAFVGLGATRIETLRLIKDAELGPIVELE